MNGEQFTKIVAERTGQQVFGIRADHDIITASVGNHNYALVIKGYWANSPAIPSEYLQWTQENAEKLIDKITGVNPKKWL